MKNTKQVGELSEAMILARFLELGFVVLQPFGDNQRYDLVVEKPAGFVRVQCKTAKLNADGSVLSFSCKSNAGGYNRRDYKGEIDAFAVYSHEIKKCFFIPIDDAGVSQMFLRLINPKNNTSITTVNWAKDYEL